MNVNHTKKKTEHMQRIGGEKQSIHVSIFE